MLQATAMVVMSVRNDGDVHLGDIQPEAKGIFGKECALSHVEKHSSAIVQLDIEAQSMFCRKSAEACVFYERSDAHILFWINHFTGHATVDGNCLPIDEIVVFLADELHHSRDVVGFSYTPAWVEIVVF